HWIPTPCRSVANVEGRCLSTCLPPVAAQPLLPTAGCQAGERCVPCFDPLSGADTGACEINPSCDQPHEPKTVLMCPYNGSVYPVINPGLLASCAPNSACTSGAHCLLNQYVPSGVASKLYSCGSGSGAGRCTPDDFIRSGGLVDPPNCNPFASTNYNGNDGRCLSKCLPDVFGHPSLESGGCPAGSACTPCYDPLT